MKKPEIEEYFYNNIRLENGEKVLNINRSIRVESDFTKYLESLANNKDSKTYLWIRYTKTTHPIFERLLPILSNWNRFDKEQFMTKGTILCSHKHVIAGYPKGSYPQKLVHNHKPLDLVWEEENIV